MLRFSTKDKESPAVWDVHNSENESYLGQVRWYEGWKRYVYVTRSDTQIVWDSASLAELQDFIAKQMVARGACRRSKA